MAHHDLYVGQLSFVHPISNDTNGYLRLLKTHFMLWLSGLEMCSEARSEAGKNFLFVMDKVKPAESWSLCAEAVTW